MKFLNVKKYTKFFKPFLTFALIRVLSQIHGVKQLQNLSKKDLVKTLTFPKTIGASVYFPVLVNCTPQSYVIELTNIWIY